LTAAVAAAALAGAALSPIPAHGQSASAATLRLVSQRLVLAPEEPFTTTLAVSGTVPEGADLVITVSSRLRSPRDDLHALLDEGDELGGTVDFLSVPLAEVPHDAAGRLSLQVPTVRRSAEDSEESLASARPASTP
jgi:hypothetical protein